MVPLTSLCPAGSAAQLLQGWRSPSPPARATQLPRKRCWFNAASQPGASPVTTPYSGRLCPNCSPVPKAPGSAVLVDVAGMSMHSLHKGTHVLGVHVGVEAVAQVGNVALGPETFQHLLHQLPNLLLQMRWETTCQPRVPHPHQSASSLGRETGVTGGETEARGIQLTLGAYRAQGSRFPCRVTSFPVWALQ